MDGTSARRMLPAIALLPGAIVALASVCGGQQPTGRSWAHHRQAVLATPGLMRYYTFEGVADPAAGVPNAVGEEAPLVLGIAGQDGLVAELVEGRWPGKPAIRLDRGFLSAKPLDVTDKTFTAETWVRLSGMGAIRGDSVPTGGTLLSVGIGYYDGWRLTMLYPDGVLGLEIGRPAGSFGIRAGPVADGVWHHIAAQWDGHRLRIYVDGIPMASGAHEGDYTPVRPDAQLRVGFAGSGWGSVACDVDEVAIYDGALSVADVVRASLPAGALTDADARALEQADAAVMNGDPEAAVRSLSQVGRGPAGAVADVWRGQILLELGQSQAALQALNHALATPDLPEGLRASALTPLRVLTQQAGDAPVEVLSALLDQAERLSPREVVQLRLSLARRLRRTGDVAAAARSYEEVLAMPDLTPTERLETQLQVGHAACLQGDYVAARRHYAAAADAADAPVYFRSHACLCTARTHVQAGEYAEATGIYRSVADDGSAPISHRWEASECVREVDRLAKGLPARDPEWSRVAIADRREPSFRLYVSPDGSDANPGTKDRPFATLERARDAIRELKQAGRIPRGAEVVLAPGEYPRSAAFALDAEDSGAPGAPIVYRAAERGAAVLSGGVRVQGFAAVTDQAILSRLPEEARGRVVQCDLRAQGIRDFGPLMAHGYGHPPVPVLEVFCDGEPLRPARWPNEGFVKTGEIVEKAADGSATFGYEGDRPTRWAQAKDAWLYGYWQWLWADEYLPVASIDAAAQTIRLGQPSAHGGVSPGMPYFALNLLEEIDQPGEWYLDRQTGLLYLYPTKDPSECDIRISLLTEPMVRMADASHVILDGLTIELGQADGVSIEGGEGCLVAGCTIRRLGNSGVVIKGGASHGVFGCDIYTLGRNGTSVSGGERKSLTPGGHFVENCHIHDFSRVDRTYTPAVWLDGVGNRVAHNRIHNSPGHAMRIEGNDHTIEFNEIYEVVRETDDQGGLDMWFNPTYRGDVIRYNFWHDIGNDRECGQAGIRLDDAISEVVVYGNVFLRCSHAQFGGLQIHGGKENIVENNLFVDCKYGISFSGWGADRWASYVTSDAVRQQTREVVDITQPPYSTRYPSLARLAENPDVNRIWRNLVVNCGQFLARDRGIQELMDNTAITDDPGFVDAENLDYALRPDSPVVRGSGFRPIPFAEIGLYEHPLRATWPVPQ